MIFPEYPNKFLDIVLYREVAIYSFASLNAIRHIMDLNTTKKHCFHPKVVVWFFVLLTGIKASKKCQENSSIMKIYKILLRNVI